jgi:HNH endonuclease
MAGTGDAYRVSDTGEIHGVNRLARTCNPWGESTRRVPARIMSQRMKDGRATVQICIDGQPRNILVHTAVLEAFRGPRPPGHMAEHINGDPTDCRLANLRWVPRRGQPRFRPHNGVDPANINPPPANSSKLDSTMPPIQQTPANSNGWSP